MFCQGIFYTWRKIIKQLGLIQENPLSFSKINAKDRKKEV